MSQILGLKEPLKSYIEDLDKFELGTSDGRIQAGGWRLFGLPQLDQEDARALAAELNAAILPIIRRFRDRKLAEFMPEAQTMSDDTFRTLINRR